MGARKRKPQQPKPVKVSDVAYWKTCVGRGCGRKFTVPSPLAGKLYSYCKLCSDRRQGEIEGQKAA